MNHHPVEPSEPTHRKSPLNKRGNTLTPETTMHRTLTLTRRTTILLLMGLFAGASILHAAENLPAAKSVEEAKLAQPDMSKPVWVIIQCDMPKDLSKMTINPNHKAALGVFFNSPAGVGFALEQGKVTRPWISTLEWCGSGLTSPDTDRDLNLRAWSHTPIAFFEQISKEKLSVIESFREVRAGIAGGQLTAAIRGSWSTQNKGRPLSDKSTPADFDLNIVASIKDACLEGTWEGKVLGYPLKGTCVGALVQAACSALDPANAIYQIEYQIEKEAVTVVVEVRKGKAVSALARRRTISKPGNQMTTTCAVDAENLSVTLAPPTLLGQGATLQGTLKIAGAGEITIQDMFITPTGDGVMPKSDAKSKTSEVSLRAYAIDDPVASQWKRWMETIFSGTDPVDAGLAQQAQREADTFAVMPAPSTASQFMHKIRGMSKNFIYAPWFDFAPVAGAKKYRFTTKTAAFDAEIPTASLLPVWNKVPLGLSTVTLTALDGSGQPVGEPQQRVFERRAPFGGEIARPLNDDDGAMELALRYPRTLARRYYTIANLWAVAQTPPHDRTQPNTFRCAHNPFMALALYSTDPAERAAARVPANAWAERQALRMTGPFGLMDSYHSFPHGFIEEEMQDILTTFEATGDPRWQETAQHFGGIHARLIQPNGSWTWTINHFDKSIWWPFSNESAYFGREIMDPNAAIYARFFGRLRHLTGDDRLRDTELKAVHWFMHNSLRNGYWDPGSQQGPGMDSLSNATAIECLRYLLEWAPASIANTALAEELARWIEDRFIYWGPVSKIDQGSMVNTGQATMAISYLCLYRATGKTLYLAKAEALFKGYLIERDPVLGLTKMRYDRYLGELDDPVDALQYVALRRKLVRRPAEAPIVLTADRATVVLTLHHAIEAEFPLVLHLHTQNGKVDRAVALTPTWDGPGIAYTQPGRLHWRDGMVLHHQVDVSTLNADAKGIKGEVVVQLKSPLPDSKPVATTFRIEAALDGRMLAGHHDGGRVDGELRPAASAKGDRIWFEVDRAVSGGEAWQNWALANIDLEAGVAARNPQRLPWQLANGNAGWSAEVQTADLKIVDEKVMGTMRAKVTWFGFRDGLKTDAKAHEEAWEKGLSFLAYWNTNEKFFGKATPGNPNGYWAPHIFPKPLGEQVEYPLAAQQPVLAGVYEYRFAGQRLGDVVAGTVTVKGPDGKERQCQFLGGVE